MKRFVTAALAMVLLVGTAYGFDRKTRPEGLPQGPAMPTSFAVFACDNGAEFSAYFQDDLFAYGNLFDFTGGHQISEVTFKHFGWATLVGPYGYDLEVWDGNTCTQIDAANGKVAADAFAATQVETENYCADNVYSTSSLTIVGVDANSCAVPSDCYPDVWFDDQLFIFCPAAVDLTLSQCFDLSQQSGPFLLQVRTNECVTDAKPTTWGSVKQRYR